MKIYFENTTVESNEAALLAYEDGLEHSQRVHPEYYGDSYAAVPNVEMIERDIMGFNIMRSKAVLQTPNWKIENVRKYRKKLEANRRLTVIAFVLACALIELLISFVLVKFIDLDAVEHFNNLVTVTFVCLLTLSGALGYIFGEKHTKKKHGHLLPNMSETITNHYRFTDKFIILDTEDEHIVMYYNEIAIYSKREDYVIGYDDREFALSSNGFSCSLDKFKDFIKEKGLNIREYNQLKI